MIAKRLNTIFQWTETCMWQMQYNEMYKINAITYVAITFKLSITTK